MLVVLKPLWAGLFGLALMVAIALTALVWSPDWALTRHDALFLIALALQGVFLVLRVETRNEAAALVLFSLLGLGLEWFNTARGTWAYPGHGLFTVGDVPLFVGFMYAAVGLCLLRLIRIFSMRFAPFPRRGTVVALAALIYANFFTQHLWVDLRLVLFAAIGAVFWRTRVRMVPWRGREAEVPLLALLAIWAGGIWLAENLGTLTGTWLYLGQQPGEWVSLATLGSWVLFLVVALVVALLVAPGGERRTRGARP